MDLRILLAGAVFGVVVWGAHLVLRRWDAASWVEAEVTVRDADAGSAGRFGGRVGARFYAHYRVDGRLFGALNLTLPGFPEARAQRLVARWLEEGDDAKATVWHHPQRPHEHVLLPPHGHRLPARLWFAVAALAVGGYLLS